MRLLYDVDFKVYYVEFNEKSTKLTFKTERDARRFMKIQQVQDELNKANRIVAA